MWPPLARLSGQALRHHWPEGWVPLCVAELSVQGTGGGLVGGLLQTQGLCLEARLMCLPRPHKGGSWWVALVPEGPQGGPWPLETCVTRPHPVREVLRPIAQMNSSQLPGDGTASPRPVVAPTPWGGLLSLRGSPPPRAPHPTAAAPAGGLRGRAYGEKVEAPASPRTLGQLCRGRGRSSRTLLVGAGKPGPGGRGWGAPVLRGSPGPPVS